MFASFPKTGMTIDSIGGGSASGTIIASMLDSVLPLSLPHVRPLLLESLPWSPHDFLKDISRTGDRAVQFDGLLRELDPADDLRLAHAIAPDAEVAGLAERLPWDSAFFGYDVARLY